MEAKQIKKEGGERERERLYSDREGGIKEALREGNKRDIRKLERERER